jgi:hypothetical protein
MPQMKKYNFNVQPNVNIYLKKTSLNN